MRPFGLEFAYDLSPVARGYLSLAQPRTIDVDVDGRLYITDYPELARPERYYSPGRNKTKIVTFHPETGRRADLDVPSLDDFQADILRITPTGTLLLAQFGQWPAGKINGLIMTPGGEIRQTFRFGECVADVGVDAHGCVCVIYNEEGVFGAARPGQPLIERFAPDGSLLKDDPFITRVVAQLPNEFDGSRLIVMRDGGLLVNGRYRFSADGTLVYSLGERASMNITVVDEHDNLLFIPPVRGGVFLMIPAPGGFAELGLESSRPIDYDDYGWFHVVRGGYLYLINKVIPKVEVFRLQYS